MHARIVQQSRHRIITAVGAALVAFAVLQNAAAAVTGVAAAARTGDIDAVKKQLAAGANVNTPEADGTSALLWAAYQSSPEIVQLLRVREPLYRECADWTVDTTSHTPEEVAELILNWWNVERISNPSGPPTDGLEIRPT